MLPQFYGRLHEQYTNSSGGHMNEHQTELLRRVNALHGMLNRDALPLDMPARPGARGAMAGRREPPSRPRRIRPHS